MTTRDEILSTKNFYDLKDVQTNRSNKKITSNNILVGDGTSDGMFFDCSTHVFSFMKTETNNGSIKMKTMDKIFKKSHCLRKDYKMCLNLF